MDKKDRSCETCLEHSSVESRLRTGNIIFGVGVTILLSVFGIMALNDSKTADTMVAIQISVAKIEASLPSIQDLQARTRALEQIERK